MRRHPTFAAPNAIRGRRTLVLLGLAFLLGTGCRKAQPELAVPDRSEELVDFGVTNEPPAGRVLHGWGQLSGAGMRDPAIGRAEAADLAAYEEAIAPGMPAMISFYVAPVPEQIRSLLATLARLKEERGSFVVLLGLYFRTLQERTARGDLDGYLAELAVGLRDLRLPVLLRIGYEFNNPWQAYRPESYVPAFRRIARLFAERGACGVAPVWHASALGLAEGPPEPWYPGDAFVAWWGLSLFHWEELTSPRLEPFLESARSHRRPVVVAEAAPVFSSRLPFRVRGPGSAAEAERWYGMLFELLRRRPEIKAFSLIAVDWRRIRSELPGWGWPDTRLERWPGAAARVRRAVSGPRYLGLREWQRGGGRAPISCGGGPRGPLARPRP